MRAFQSHTGIAASLPFSNIDTDKILPGPFLKTISREGLGRHLFHMMRYDDHGAPRSDFVLNQAPWDQATILVTLDNFGCGSSREHAPWALWDFGVRCIIAPSFADIFYNNCFKNGILPVTFDRRTIDALLLDVSSPSTASLTVCLKAQTVTRIGGEILQFDIDPARKAALLEGRDEISASLDHLSEIEAWEVARQDILPTITF